MKFLSDIFCSFVMKFRTVIARALYHSHQVKGAGSLALYYLKFLCYTSWEWELY